MLRLHLAPVILLLAPLAAQQALSTTYGLFANGRTGAALAGGGDLDGDQTPDLLISSPTWTPGRVQVVSGMTWTTRTILNTGTNNFGLRVLTGTPDMNLDGVRDILVESGNDLVAYSGATLAVLWQTQAPSNQIYLLAVPVGDLDTDGRCDLAAAMILGGTHYVWTLSGANGSMLQTSTPLPAQTNCLALLGDVNGDSRPEIVLGTTSSTVHVRQVLPSSTLSTFQIPGQTVLSVAAGNLAGDARNEVLVSNGLALRVHSATTGSLIRTIPGTGEFAVLGDLTADGVADLAVRTTTLAVGDGVDFRSGANGGLLAQWFGTASFRCAIVAAAGDVNGDGFGDLLLGDPDATLLPSGTPWTGAWQLLSAKLLATMQSMPATCAQGPFFPQLGVTRPRLGFVATVEGRDAPAGAVGFLAFSPQPGAPTNLGVMGCDAWFDLSNGLLLHQPTGVNWTFQFPVPAAPQLAGCGFALQAFYAPTFSAIGMDLSNGVWARLGY